MFKELAHIFSDDDNQRLSREVLNRVSSYMPYYHIIITLKFCLLKTFDILLHVSTVCDYLLLNF